MVYDLTCNGCKFIYVGQIGGHITTRVAEHAKADSTMGLHAIECNGDTIECNGDNPPSTRTNSEHEN